jgi:hypothetical protein
MASSGKIIKFGLCGLIFLSNNFLGGFDVWFFESDKFRIRTIVIRTNELISSTIVNRGVNVFIIKEERSGVQTRHATPNRNGVNPNRLFLINCFVVNISS